jgi:hypothetical protein
VLLAATQLREPLQKLRDTSIVSKAYLPVVLVDAPIPRLQALLDGSIGLFKEVALGICLFNWQFLKDV